MEEATANQNQDVLKLKAENKTLRSQVEELTRENTEQKQQLTEIRNNFGTVGMTPDKLQRVKNDNRRLLALTERINKQRGDMENKLKEKKQEIEECHQEIDNLKVKLNDVDNDRSKLKNLVESLLQETERLRNEIEVLKDGKTFADFVELKRKIRDLKDENSVLSNGFQTSDCKRGIQFNMNDIFAMLRHKLSPEAKPNDTTEGVNKERRKSSSVQKVLILDEREMEESIKKDHQKVSLLPCCSDPPSTPTTPRPLLSRNSVNRITFVSPPRSMAASPRTYSRQCSRERRETGPLPGVGQGAAQTHFIVKRRTSPRWPSLSELNERYQFALQSAWAIRPNIETVTELNRHHSNGK